MVGTLGLVYTRYAGIPAQDIVESAGPKTVKVLPSTVAVVLVKTRRRFRKGGWFNVLISVLSPVVLSSVTMVIERFARSMVSIVPIVICRTVNVSLSVRRANISEDEDAPAMPEINMQQRSPVIQRACLIPSHRYSYLFFPPFFQ
jgi:hypothetical protein